MDAASLSEEQSICEGEEKWVVEGGGLQSWWADWAAIDASNYRPRS